MTTPIIKTSRLTLRYLRREDAEMMLDYQLRNKDNFSKVSPIWSDDFYTLSFWKEGVKKWNEQFENDKSVRLSLFLDEKLIGICTFVDINRGSFQGCMAGYNIDEDYEGKGLMSEAFSASIDYIFKEKNLHKVDAFFMCSNVRSQKVLERHDFEKVGICRKELLINGQWEDHTHMRLINPNWKL